MSTTAGRLTIRPPDRKGDHAELLDLARQEGIAISPAALSLSGVLWPAQNPMLSPWDAF